MYSRKITELGDEAYYSPGFVCNWIQKLSDLSGHQLFHFSNGFNPRTQSFPTVWARAPS